MMVMTSLVHRVIHEIMLTHACRTSESSTKKRLTLVLNGAF